MGEWSPERQRRKATLEGKIQAYDNSSYKLMCFAQSLFAEGEFDTIAKDLRDMGLKFKAISATAREEIARIAEQVKAEGNHDEEEQD